MIYTDNNKQTLHALGLCARARKLIIGTDLICKAVAEKSIFLVAEASNTSAGTHKRISDKCSYYQVQHIRIQADTDALAAAIGKDSMIAAVGITDEQMVKMVLHAIEKDQTIMS